jgi:hypothetical protein
VEETEVGQYYVSMGLRNRLSNLRWILITVYGPAQHNLSANFISKSSRKCMCATLPVVFGGDFNLIRRSEDRNYDNVNHSLMDRFNMFIDMYQLQELRRCGQRYTWSNK